MNKSILLSALMLICGIHASRANHVMGSEVTWKYIGNDTFLIKLVAYRQCTDGAAGMSLPGSPPYINSDSCTGFSFSRSPGPIISYIVEDITPLCISQQKPCTMSGGSGIGTSGIPLGIERHTATYKIYLGGNYTNCCWYKIRWGFCCRNTITTGFVGGDFYNESWLNRCLPNSSPRFTNPPLLIKQANSEVRYNPGMVDEENDSLSYRMMLPSAAGNYDPPWSYKYPLTCYGGNIPNPNSSPPSGFSFDSITGDMVFFPTQILSTVIKFAVYEWRRVGGVLKNINVVTRDIGFMVMQSSNKIPVTSTPYNYNFCAGHRNCFTIHTGDQDAAETTSLTLDSTFNLPGATFTTTTDLNDRAHGTLCWTPDSTDVRSQPYYLSVKLKDNHCPFYAETYRRYTIKVNPEFNIKTALEKLGCAEYNFKALNTDSTSFFKRWQVLKGNYVLNTFQNTDTVENYKFANTGTYYVKYTASNNNCTITHTDTVVVKNADILQLQVTADTAICNGASLKLKAIPLNGTTPFTYKWYLNGVLFDTTSSPIVKPNLDSEYSVSVFSSDSCRLNNKDTIYVQVHSSALNVSAINDTIVCTGASLNFKADILSGTPPFQFTWYEKGNLIDTSSTLNITPKANTVLVFSVYSSDPCFNIYTDSITILIDTSSLIVLPVPDTISCAGKNIKVNPIVLAGHPPFSFQWFANGQLISTSASLDIIANNSSQYIFKVQSTNLCNNYFEDTFNIEIDTSVLRMKSIPDQSLCSDSMLVITPVLLIGKPPFKYRWFKNGTFLDSTSTITIEPDNNATYFLNMSSSDRCDNQFNDTFHVLSYPSKQVSVFAKTTSINKGQSITLTTNGYPPFQWSGIDISNNWNDSIEVKPLASSTYKLYCKNNDGCYDTAEIVISVIAVGIQTMESKVDFSLSPNPAGNLLKVIYNESQSPLMYEIYNAFGTKVQEGFITNPSNHVDIELLADGVYFYRMNRKCISFIKAT